MEYSTTVKIGKWGKIRASATDIGSELAKAHPEIASEYITQQSIRDNLDSPMRDIEYHRRNMVGRTARELAKRYLGHVIDLKVRGLAFTFALGELIPEEEMKKEGRYRKRYGGFIGPKDAKVSGGRKGGTITNEKHGCTLTDAGRKAAVESLRRIWNSKSPEEKEAELNRLRSVGGTIPWSSGEFIMASLYSDPEVYRENTYQEGPFKGNANYRVVAARLNKVWGNDRSPEAVRVKVKA